MFECPFQPFFFFFRSPPPPPPCPPPPPPPLFTPQLLVYIEEMTAENDDLHDKLAAVTEHAETFASDLKESIADAEELQERVDELGTGTARCWLLLVMSL